MVEWLVVKASLFCHPVKDLVSEKLIPEAVKKSCQSFHPAKPWGRGPIIRFRPL
jgi:hypothetical protein